MESQWDDIRDEDSNGRHSSESKEIFEKLKPWIAEFLDNNTNMTASQVGYNQLVEKVNRVTVIGKFNLHLTCWLIWHKCQRASVIMNFPSCVVIVVGIVVVCQHYS